MNKTPFKLYGIAKADFHRWAIKEFGNDLYDVENWHYSDQLKYYSNFFKVPINNLEELQSELEKYNAKESNL